MILQTSQSTAPVRLSKPEARVCHMSSVHRRHDTRIFLKECRSLANAGYDVTLVVADGLGDETTEGVKIVDAGVRAGSRLSRFVRTTKRVYETAKQLDADIYHLHDPELLPWGRSLARSGKTVIYDAHEDLPRQALTKPYVPRLIRPLAEVSLEFVENSIARRLAGIVSATPGIHDRFSLVNESSVNVNNYPFADELFPSESSVDRENQACFVGAIKEIRGIRALINAFELVEGKLVIAGRFSSAGLEEEMRQLPGWANVDYRGFLGREEVAELLAKSKAGIVTFLPAPNHVASLPNKMFEYMSAGLPVIASNFPNWKSIIEENDCGACVDPSDPKEIAEAVQNLFSDDEAVKRQGNNGREIVLGRCNWPIEEQKLLEFYQGLRVES